MGDKVSAFSLASVVPTALSAPSTPASGANSSRKLRTGAGSRLSSPISSIQSFRRKKYVRQRLSPLAGGDLNGRQTRFTDADDSSEDDDDSGGDGDRERTGGREELGDADNGDEEDSPANEIDRLQRFHATLSSPERIQQWILTYESEKQRFASFAVFAEMKLDEIRDVVVGRPNAVEVAACFASLIKIPGIVGCYSELLEKLAAGIQSAIYLPDDVAVASASPMATLVQSFFGRKTYFAHVHELETQLFKQRSIRDASVLRSLSVGEVVRVLVQAPLGQLQRALAEIAARESCSPLFEQLLLFMNETHSDRLRERHVRQAIRDDEDETYPFFLPLASSAQICRAISHSASAFSASGKEMILCAILEFVDVDAFKDVFRRFDARAKALFLHHLSVTESSDHLQSIVGQLPNAGEAVFRFYSVACGAQSDPMGVAKRTLFLKLLGAETEYFFLCDLAAYLNEEQFLLLSKEYEKSVQERKRLRRGRRATSLSEAGGDFAGDFDDDEDEDESSGGGDGRQRRRSVKSTIESFQLLIWNFLHHHRLTSAQVLAIVTTVMLPSLEATEFGALIDHALEHFPLDGRWLQLLRVVSEMEAEHGAAPAAPTRAAGVGDNNEADAVGERVRETRVKVLKKLFSMLSRQERESWLDKINAKYTTDAMKKKIQLLKQKASRKVVITAAPEPPPPPPPSLNDPKAHVPLMDVELKMQWVECLLDAIVTDKEHSARMAMLRQVLQPFLDGHAPAGAAAPKVSAVAVEKSIVHLLNQLTQAEKAKLLLKIAPAPVLEVKPRLDRATSPVPELREEPPVVALPPALPTSNPDILSAFQSLVACKSEERVLQLLRAALVAADGAAGAGDSTAAEPEGHAPGLSMGLKRKLSAVVAVAEPMEWHEHVTLVSVDAACQTGSELAAPSVDATAPLVVPADKPPARGSVLPTRMAPLTLSALLGRPGAGSPRKKEGKYQKLNSAAVPRAIGGLITSWRMNADQLAQFSKKSLSVVLKTVADAYGEMLTAGRRKTALPFAPARGRELSLAQVVYQQFLHSYGLPGIADMHLLAFSCAIEAYRAQHLRVEYFARFCFEEVPKPELGNYLEFLECIVCDDMNVVGSSSGGVKAQPQAPPKRTRFVPRISVPDKENWCIGVDKAQEAAHLCFRAMRKTSVAAFCDRLVAIAALGTSSSSLSCAHLDSSSHAVSSAPTPSAAELVINVDHLLQLVAHEWRDEQLRRDNHLLDAFRAGDVNGDGQLTSAEFSQIVLSIDRTRELGDILLMFSETLRRTECDQINTEVFVQVAKEYELDRAVWNEDGDLRNIVNDVSELEATWGGVRRFFLGTLEALARDLPATHFLRVCEGAGCGCLKCILDGYIGFQKMRRDFALAQQQRLQLEHDRGGLVSVRRSPVAISESLVWARFWHLMRQIFDAAAESDGILTPWEGCSGGSPRATPAPAMPPRFVARRRNALPNILFPDTNRISAKMRAVHDPEAFDADMINEQFADLLAHMTYKKPDATGSGGGGGGVAES
ncbi:hypothetical protein PybrP1_003464 [[Pythium] brassicae (nom. inval.)]|nr:hypothetical protein PybrP1_003464 [[Pythium] brassicae (nom. inval.)]